MSTSKSTSTLLTSTSMSTWGPSMSAENLYSSTTRTNTRYYISGRKDNYAWLIEWINLETISWYIASWHYIFYSHDLSFVHDGIEKLGEDYLG